MEKGIPVIFIFLLLSWCHQASATRYEREYEGVSSVLFRKKLKEVAHGLWDEMGNEKQRPLLSTQSEDNTLAQRKACKGLRGKAAAASEPHPSALPREEQPLLINGC
ncbi:Uncharacterised protein [Serratia quinivorans]|uniref:Uncharacterized protein n=1 Tax=Serratia quinivorans TaxID=137545 RepID=A0ABV3UF16_9GAMM|nr:hypothetical protein [Serratia quinivorans]CAI1505187.1 Uncharacterised protein [Serratia quinivorans]CAI1680867.1 Uncharacterised protein [Serratia quinivorans]